MGKEKLEQLKYHKKKRDIFLFFLLCIFFLVPGSFLTLLFLNVETDLLFMIYLPIFLVTVWIILKYRNKLIFHSMYYQYYLMINDDMGMINLPNKIFTPSWLNKIKNNGYNKENNFSDFLYFYKVLPKVKKYIYSKSIVLICVFAKNEKFDFYSNNLDDEIKKVYQNDILASKSRRHIVLQFKKYQSYSEIAKEEIDKIINFKVGRDNLIHINIGYFVDQNSIYFLRPKKRYPNKYYYYAVQLIKEYCGIIN